MIVNVTGRHVEINDTLREHVGDRLRAELADFPRIESVHVILMVEKHRHVAEIVAQVPHHGTVEAKHESNDMYASIDAAIEKTAVQLRKWAEKVHEHKAEKLGRVDKVIHAKDGAEPAAG